MLATNDWAYHIQQRDHFRLAGLFASDRAVGKRYEARAHQHSRLARQAFEAGSLACAR